MNKEALLSPDEIAAITERDEDAFLSDAGATVRPAEMDRRRLLRDREAIAAEVEREVNSHAESFCFCAKCGHDNPLKDADIEYGLRSLIKRLRGEA